MNGEDSTLLLATGASTVALCLAVVLASRAFLRDRAAAAAAGTPAEEGDKAPRLGGLAQALRPKTAEELSELRRLLARAGMRAQEAVDLFSVTRTVVLLVSAGLFFILIVASGFDPGAAVFGSLVLALGLYGPRVWLSLKIKQRQEALALSLPPTLDLLVTCMEAGLGLEQALARVAGEIDYSDPEMAEELTVVVAELRAGLSVGETFRKLADRVTSDEVRNLSNVIVQSAMLGASLGRTLREYAASARRRRVLSLEELAGKVTARLVLPLALCLLPSAMLAMLGPAVVIIVRSMGS